MTPRNRRPRRARRASQWNLRPIAEAMEPRIVLSTSNAVYDFYIFNSHGSSAAGSMTPFGVLPSVGGSQSPVGYTPIQIRTAYGVSSIAFGSVTGNGAGQTIAIVDAYDEPAFVNSTASNFSTSDLAMFDKQFGLPDPPSFEKVNQNGSTSGLPGTDPAGAGNINWETEEALDVEWAHSMAPAASIILVEANSPSNGDLFSAVKTAASLPGVSVVSMSWGGGESASQLSLDSTFATPSGHTGVTFLASTGDSGSPGGYPAYSPNVVAVGGTSLYLNSDNTYKSESAWSGSGGGTSQFESEPAYQLSVQTTGKRTIPDVSFLADPGTGVAIYDSYNDTDGSGPWVQIGGTSLACPSWAGLIAIADQGRVSYGGSPLDGPGQTLPDLYSLPKTDFHDITSGSNGGFSAGPGYDEVTGIGTPIANLLVPDLAGINLPVKMAITAEPPANVIQGDPFAVAVAAEDPAGHIVTSYTGTFTIALTTNPTNATLGGTFTAQAVNGVATFGDLTLNDIGSGYVFTVTSTQFGTLTTTPMAITANTTPWQGTFYPGPADEYLRAAVLAADSNAFATNVIELQASTYTLTNTSLGQIVIQDASSSIASKTLIIEGLGASSTFIASGVPNWSDRLFEIEGSTGANVNVVFQNLTIKGGNASGGGSLGGNVALGGGLLVTGGAVTLQNVTMCGNKAQGAAGAAGASGGATPKSGGVGTGGRYAEGGAIYMAGGTLSLIGDTFAGNQAVGGAGGKGGAGGAGNHHQGQAGKVATGGVGGAGASGGAAFGGAFYVAGGSINGQSDLFLSNSAVGGVGGQGGTGGQGGIAHPGGRGGVGGVGSIGSGGGIYIETGTISLNLSTFSKNVAVGGAGGKGGHGGQGGSYSASPSVPSSKLPTGPGATGGVGGKGGVGGGGLGAGIFIRAGVLVLSESSISGNSAVGGAGGVGGQGGHGETGSSASKNTGGVGGVGGTGSAAYAGAISSYGGKVTVIASTLSNNKAIGGAGGQGGEGGAGGGFVSGRITGGPGGKGGKGSNGDYGGLYIIGGSLSFINSTIADNSANPGAGGLGGNPGPSGPSGSFSSAPKGAKGGAGTAAFGGAYVAGGTLTLTNSTFAFNTVTGTSQNPAGLFQVAAGVVNVTSSLVAGNGSVDVSGNINATDSLFQTKDASGAITGSGNQVGVDPKFDAKGLQNNGGPTQTIALQTGSPAIGAGSNPLGLLTDQRGAYGRSASGKTDIGAYETSAVNDTVAPTATLSAVDVTTGNVGGLNPYQFTVTYTDNIAINALSLAGAVVTVIPPVGGPAVTASVVSTVASGPADAIGDAQTFTVTYQFTPPGGAWSYKSDGTYEVMLGGTPISDFGGNTLPNGPLGTFKVVLQTVDSLIFTSEPPLNASAGQLFSVTVDAFTPTNTLDTSFNGLVTLSLTSNPENASLQGVVLGNAHNGVITFSGLSIDIAGLGYTIMATSGMLIPGVSTTITINPGTVAILKVTQEPPLSNLAGAPIPVAITAYDAFGNIVNNSVTDVSIALGVDPTGAALFGTKTEGTVAGVATFTDLSIQLVGTGYQFTASAGLGVTNTISVPFAVVPAGPAKIVVTTEPQSTVTAGSPFSLSATVEDTYGNPTGAFTGGLAVAISTDPTNAALNGTLTATPDANGVAVFSGLSIDTAGSGYILIVIGGTLSGGLSTPITVNPAAASKLIVATEPPGAIQAGVTFGLSIFAEDQYDNIDTSYAQTISLSIDNNPGGSTLFGTTTVTAAGGVATFSGLYFNKVGVGYTLEAQSGVIAPAVTTAITVTRAPASQLVVTTQPPASVVAGAKFGLIVSAEDRFGNLDPSYEGNAVVALAANPGISELVGSISTNLINGIGVFTGLTIDRASVGYTIQVTNSNLASGVSTPITVTPATANHLVIVQQPSGAVTAGVGFGLFVLAEDGFDNVDTNFSGNITATLQTSSNGAVLGGGTVLAASAGQAGFTSLTLDKVGEGNVILVSSGLLGGAVTTPISVNPDTAATIGFLTAPPATTIAGQAFSVTAVVKDAQGNTDVSYTGPVTVALAVNPTGAVLGGTTTMDATAGVATFGNLTLQKAGSGYVLYTAAGPLPVALSSPILVTAAAATHLVVISAPPSSLQAGQTFGMSVAAVDPFGNLDASFTNEVTASVASGVAASALSGTTSVQAAGGIANFQALTLGSAGSGITLQALGGGLLATTQAISVSGGSSGSTGGSGSTTTSPTPVPIEVSGESLLFVGKGRKRKLVGFEITYSGGTPDGATAFSASNYHLTQTFRKARKLVNSPVGLTAEHAASGASNAVDLLFAGKPKFAFGGTLQLSPGITDTAGTSISGPTTFTILKKAKGILG